MKLKDFVLLTLATVCGFIGGVVAARRDATRMSPATITSYVVHTSRIELVDSSDRPRAILATDPHSDQTTLSFLTKEGRAVAAFGVGSDLPFFRFIGTDGESRAVLQLSRLQQPRLFLTNGTPEVSVELGAFEGDFNPTRETTSWGLQFANSRYVLARVGMGKRGAEPLYSGGLVVNSKEKKFSAP